MAVEWSRRGVETTYEKWAPVYDKVFGSIFDAARRQAVGQAGRAGGCVLEVGVGTGLSLPLYPASCRITGIDISEAMLEVARRRVARERLSNVESIVVMDAQNLQFDDNSFDVVMAQYVVNTVPDPDAVLDEMWRVLRPGGELIIVNRIGADRGARLKLERLFQPIAEKLGWRSEFPWHRFESWAVRAGNAELVDRRPVPPFGHFAVIRFSKTRSGSSDGTSSARPPSSTDLAGNAVAGLGIGQAGH